MNRGKGKSEIKYFERPDPRGSQFWEIDSDAAKKTVSMRSGTGNWYGRVQKKKFKNQNTLEDFFQNSVDKKINLGFVEDRRKVLIISGKEKKKRLHMRVPMDSEKVLLIYHGLREIDLKPLVQLKNLQEIDLSGNDFVALDLFKFEKCRKLKILGLSRNNLNKVDLKPIALCKNLVRLKLMFNTFKTLDLSPLNACKKLEIINLQGNKNLKTVDLTALQKNKALKWITVSRGLKVEGAPKGIELRIFP